LVEARIRLQEEQKPWRRRSKWPWNYLHSITFGTKFALQKSRGLFFILVSIESFEIVNRRR
jgi:hypothetical protein